MTDQHDERPDGAPTDDPHETDVTFDDWSGLFPERVETDRLDLRRLSPETVDVHEMYDVCAHDDGIEQVTEHVTWDPHPHPKETHEYLTAVEEGWDEGESAQYAIFPDDVEEFAGACGLNLEWERRTATMGMWLRKRFWGRGYSGERAAALFALAFEHLDLEVVEVEHTVANEASERAIRKYIDHFGGREDGLVRNGAVTDGDPVDVRRYSVSREEYEAAVAD